jgi:hypothetical protein
VKRGGYHHNGSEATRVSCSRIIDRTGAARAGRRCANDSAAKIAKESASIALLVRILGVGRACRDEEAGWRLSFRLAASELEGMWALITLRR